MRNDKDQPKRVAAALASVLRGVLIASSSVLAAGALPHAVEAQTVPSYFEDLTSVAFPPAPCVDPANANSVGCYTSWLLVSDIDGDDDLDILFANGGGYYVPGNAEPSSVYLNDGSGGFRDVTATTFGGAVSRLRQVSVGDIDGDGDRDIYQPGGFGMDLDKLWVQTEPGVFENRAAFQLPGTLKSRAGASHFGDLDGDGDIDLAIADWGEVPLGRPSSTTSKGNTWIYLNDGDGYFSQLPASAVPPPIEVAVGRTPIDLDFADIDGDFDLDILVNHRNGQSRIFINDGKAKFTDGTTNNYPVKKGPYVYNQELCDFDEDGDLDMLLDNAGNRISGQGNFSQVLVNDGTGHFEDKTMERISGEPGGDDNAVKCADVNGDGHYDLLVASLTVPSEKLLINDGTAHFSFVPDALPITSDPTLGIDAADLDGDDILDIVTGQGEGNLRIDRIFKGVGSSKADVTAPKFRAVEKPTPVPGKEIVIRLAVTDATTSETGEHVRSVTLAYKAGSAAAKSVEAAFIGGDLFRAVIPAQPNGTLLTLTPKAIDRAGTLGTGESFDLVVGVIEEPDAGVETDAGVEADAGEVDAGVEVDAGEADAGVEVDAGAEIDAGAPEEDAATQEDAAAPEPDAGDDEEEEEPEEEEPEDEEEVDAGAPMADAGTGTKPSSDDCSLAPHGSSTRGLGLAILIALVLLSQRRRHRARVLVR